MNAVAVAIGPESAQEVAADVCGFWEGGGGQVDVESDDNEDELRSFRILGFPSLSAGAFIPRSFLIFSTSNAEEDGSPPCPSWVRGRLKGSRSCGAWIPPLARADSIIRLLFPGAGCGCLSEEAGSCAQSCSCSCRCSTYRKVCLVFSTMVAFISGVEVDLKFGPTSFLLRSCSFLILS